MSMIEKQLNDLELLRDSLLLRDNHTARNTVCEAIDTIKALSAKVQAQNLHDGWILCSERLPYKREDDGLSDDVLITNGESVTCGHYYYLTNKWYSSGIVFNCVAWMPLPSPYKES